MTVTITQNITDITGVDDDTVIWFAQYQNPRIADDGVTMISTHRVSAKPVGGVLSVQLEPGPCRVSFGVQSYDITVPDADGALWPLVEAALPVPPAEVAHAVVNAGGVARAIRITESAYLALTTKDPETLYVVVEG